MSICGRSPHRRQRRPQRVSAGETFVFYVIQKTYTSLIRWSSSTSVRIDGRNHPLRVDIRAADSVQNVNSRGVNEPELERSCSEVGNRQPFLQPRTSKQRQHGQETRFHPRGGHPWKAEAGALSIGFYSDALLLELLSN